MKATIGTATLSTTGPITYTVGGVTFQRGVPTSVTDQDVWDRVSRSPHFHVASVPQPTPKVVTRERPATPPPVEEAPADNADSDADLRAAADEEPAADSKPSKSVAVKPKKTTGKKKGK